MDYSTSLLTLIAWKILPDELRYVILTIRGCYDRPRVRVRVHMSCGEMLFHHKSPIRVVCSVVGSSSLTLLPGSMPFFLIYS